MRVFNLLELLPDYLREEVAPPCPWRMHAIRRISAITGRTLAQAWEWLDCQDGRAIDIAEALLATDPLRTYARRHYH
jgi:hypothetical protein